MGFRRLTLSGHGLYTYDVNNNLVMILGQNYVSVNGKMITVFYTNMMIKIV
jgi:hypothetical protein